MQSLLDTIERNWFTRIIALGVLFFVACVCMVSFMALGAMINRHFHAADQDPKACTSRYLGEIAYWADGPDNTMVCQRMDRNTIQQRRCANNLQKDIYR